LQAIRNLFRGKLFDETFLMSVASVGALALGEYFEAVAVMLFAGVGELFESCAVANARGAIKELAKLCPDTVELLKDGNICIIAAENAQIGDVFIVNPGDRIALDGVIISGKSSLDKSALTGESLPVDVREGDFVCAGTINLVGELRIRATKTTADSFAARILACVEDAASKKSRAETLITRFSLWYTPAVCALAAFIAFVVPLFFGGYAKSFSQFSYIALEFLVVSCPCALIISVPLTFFGSIGGAAKQGVLFKSNTSQESLAKLSVCVFDKTGTLTNGVFSVCDVQAAENVTQNELFKAAYTAEKGSTHPIAKAISEHAQSVVSDVSLQSENAKISEFSGLGRVFEDENTVIFAGNNALLNKFEVEIPENSDRDDASSVVYIAKNAKYLGCITLRDQPKEQAKNAVQTLQKSSVRCVMLSGDSHAAAGSVASELGIDEFNAKLLPEDKLRILEGYISKKGKGCVAFVGDGINDAPSLARADVGIAMGAMGSDAAIEAADIVISDDDPQKIARAHLISKRTVRIARQNIVFAIGVKVLVMILCTIGVVNMWGAVFADVGVSVIAILNAMRTLKMKN